MNYHSIEQSMLEDWAGQGRLEDCEKQAYMAGNKTLAGLYAKISDLQQEVETLEGKLEEAETIDDWEERHGDPELYKEFFYDCFELINYPAPSVTSDYDKGVILGELEGPREVWCVLHAERLVAVCKDEREAIRVREEYYPEDDVHIASWIVE